MTSNLASAPCREAARYKLLERQLRRYHPRFRAAVSVLAMRHPRLADLAASFPALLFALAVPRAGQASAPALARVIGGFPLAEVAAMLEVPMWLRKLPPEAFMRPIVRMPDGERFRRDIANHLPRSPRLAPIWLGVVADVAELSCGPVAIWIARELTRDPRQVELDRLRLIALWSWFSGQAATIGHDLVDKPWTADMRIGAALAAASSWRTTVTLHANLGDEPIADMWLQAGRVAGYDFLPLSSAATIAEEAKAMKNCLRTYGYSLAHNHSRFWSIRRDGERIATLRVATRYRDPLPNIVEIRGARNKEAPRDVWWTARQWLHRHDLSQIDIRPRDRDTALLDRAVWRSLWRPYWVAKRRIPEWLPLAPSRDVLRAL